MDEEYDGALDDDSGPRTLSGEDWELLEQYGIATALEEVRDRWAETRVQQKKGDALLSTYFSTRPVAKALHQKLRKELRAAERKAKKLNTLAAHEAFQKALSRCELVSGDHPGTDEELIAEYKAVSPIIEKVNDAIKALETLEAALGTESLTAWYRGRSGTQGYYSSDQERWILLGKRPTEPAQRGKRIWFDRNGVDPLVGLRIIREILKTLSMEKPGREKRQQFVHEQTNLVIELSQRKDKTIDWDTASKLLKELNYPAKSRNRPTLIRRASFMEDKLGFVFEHEKPGRRPKHR